MVFPIRLYLEDMPHLPETAPRIYQAFLQVQFVIKRTHGKFKAVAACSKSNKQLIGHRKVVVVSLVTQGRKTLLLNRRCYTMK